MVTGFDGEGTETTKWTVQDLDISIRRALVRVDSNVPPKNGIISDDSKMRAALPPLRYLTITGARRRLPPEDGRQGPLRDGEDLR